MTRRRGTSGLSKSLRARRTSLGLAVEGSVDDKSTKYVLTRSSKLLRLTAMEWTYSWSPDES